MKQIKIGIIGGGHMGQALARGILRNQKLLSSQIIICTPHKEKLKDFAKATNCFVTTNNKEAVKDADIIFIAVKPAQVKEVAEEISSAVSVNALVISVAAAVSLPLLASYFVMKMKLVRIMPNIPVAFGKGVIGWIGKNITIEDEQVIKNILSSLGLVIDCKSEDQLDRLSLISGCGPGVVAYIIHIFETIAADYGFNSKQSLELVLATIEGTVNHLKNHALSSEELVEEVATPGGITKEIIHNLEKKKVPQAFSQSLERGYDKINKLILTLDAQKKSL